MRKKQSILIFVVMIVASLALAISSVWDDSPIVDEIPHIGAGYSYMARLDNRLNPEHPPLAKDLAGLSLKIYGIKDQPAFDSRFWQQDLNGQWEFGRKLIFNSGNDANVVAHVAKIPELLFFILSAIIVFLWTKKISGHSTALMASFLFLFSPTVIAHSRFVTTDVPALFGVLLSSYFFVRYLQNQTKKNLWIAGLALGVAELTKFSVFLMVPFIVVMAIAYAFVNSPKQKIYSSLKLLLSSIFIIAIGYLFVVWPVYVLQTWNYPPKLQAEQTKTLLQTYGNRHFADPVVYFADKPIFRGIADYGLGLLMVNQRAEGGNTTFFMGEIRNWAWKQYFPIVYFIKEPLPLWGLLILAWTIWSVGLRSRGIKQATRNSIHWIRDNFDRFFMLMWVAFYWTISINANLNIGVRHLMPVYGFTFILLSCALSNISRVITSKKLFSAYFIVVGFLLSWYLYENLNVYPFYLTYFNQVAGGPSGGYRYVVDSNLDWGQDMKRLADWVKENHIQYINLDYFGWSDQSFYLGNNFRWIFAGRYPTVQDFLDENPNGGYIAVSASYYMGSREKPDTSYAWLDNYKPVTIIGHSIFVWYIPPFK